MFKILVTFVLAVLGAGAHAADRPSLNDLADRGFTPVAGGYLTMKRVFLVVPTWTGFAAPSDPVVSMSGEGPIPAGELLDIIGRKGVFVRMAKQAEEYVCVYYNTEICHRVTSAHRHP